MAAPLKGENGRLLSNPDFKQIAIDSELLVIDASQLQEINLVNISATYYITVTSSTSPLAIWFIDNNIDNGNYHIILNGQTLKSSIVYPDSVPVNWKAPNELIHNNRILNFTYQPQDYVAFVLPALMPGKHILQINYKCKTNESFEMPLVKAHAIVYMLKTSDSWRSFGPLSLIVKKPNKWDASTNLPLKISGNQLIGNWASLPADYISLTLSKQTSGMQSSASTLQAILSLIFFALCSLLWGVTMINRETQSAGLIFLKGIGLSFLNTCLFYFVYTFEKYVYQYFLGFQLNPNYGRSSGYAILAFPIIWGFLMAVLLVIWLFYALISRVPK